MRAPDGTTILITTGPTMYLLPMVEAKPSFDHARDFVPVSLLGRFEFARRRRSGDRTRRIFAQLVALAQGQSGQVVVRRAEQRHHSAFHRIAARADARHPDDARALSRRRADREGPRRRPSAVCGHHARRRDRAASGRQRARRSRSSSEKRSPFLPDVPTLKENGIDLVADAWYGMWLPAGSCAGFRQAIERGRGARRSPSPR